MSEMKNSLLRGLAFSLGVLLAVSAAVVFIVVGYERVGRAARRYLRRDPRLPINRHSRARGVFRCVCFNPALPLKRAYSGADLRCGGVFGGIFVGASVFRSRAQRSRRYKGSCLHFGRSRRRDKGSKHQKNRSQTLNGHPRHRIVKRTGRVKNEHKMRA